MAKRKAVPAPRARAWLESLRIGKDASPYQLAIDVLKALDTGDVDAALKCMFVMGQEMGVTDWICRHAEGQNLQNKVMVDGLETLIAKAMREEGHSRYRKEEATERDKRVNLAHDLWAEYDPADVKTNGRKAIHKEIGEIMQRRLELAKPVPTETVRDYLKQKKTGEG